MLYKNNGTEFELLPNSRLIVGKNRQALLLGPEHLVPLPEGIYPFGKDNSSLDFPDGSSVKPEEGTEILVVDRSGSRFSLIF